MSQRKGYCGKRRPFTDIGMRGHGVPDTEVEFTMRYMMLIHHDEVAFAKVLFGVGSDARSASKSDPVHAQQRNVSTN